MRLRRKSRSASSMVEFAIVAPVAFLLLLGLVIGGMGVFRYQQLAHLAREGSRYASLHGAAYATDTKKTAATSTDVYTNAIYPNSAGLDLTKLKYSVTWNQDNNQTYTKTVNGNTVTVANTVTVKLTYTWTPMVYISGGVTMTSSSTSTMIY